MISIKQKIRVVFENYLCKFGWRCVYCTSSGVLEKNGTILFLQQPENRPANEVGDGSIATVYSEFSQLRGASWRLEKNGWLLDYGTLSVAFAGIYEFGEVASSYLKFLSLAETINSYSEMSDEELAAYKKGYLTVKKKESVPTIEFGDFTFKDTGMFIANVEADPEIGKVFQSNTVYKLVDLNGATGTFRTYDQSLEGLSRKAPFTFDCKVIMQLEKLRSIIAVRIVNKEVERESIELRSVIAGDTVILPKAFNIFGLKGAQRVSISQAMAEGLNYTPLLSPGLAANQCNAILDLLRIDDSVGKYLLNTQLSAQQLCALEPYVRNGYSVKDMVEGDLPAEYITLNYSDLQQGVSEYCDSLAGYSPEALQVIRRVRTYGSVSHVLFNEHPLFLEIRDELYRGNFVETGKYFRLDGLVLSDTLLKADWSNAPIEVKNEFRKVLNSKSFMFGTRKWDDVLSGVFESCMYIVYHAKFGFALRCPQFYVGVDYNSLILYDVAFEPEWRAVIINNEVFTDEVSQISFSI